ncbi:uncharacterized protein LOC124692210 [Lolium rigidum]|uniref:uncharacterized protein LOC124692210 n=1 Tax=Lolium rigidum TaxID=89674 RepID=UPI001F5D566E|nr:uncharacterized protein LOC124692210 [Lolium rigidum]XP_047081488.1 uncharacterized protein LOC124692210 [Lolium rigidum]
MLIREQDDLCLQMCRCRDMEAGLLMLLSSRVGDDELLLHTAQCIGQARMGGGGFRRAPGRDDVAPYLWRKRRRGTYRLMSDSPHRTRSCGGWSSSKTGSELVKVIVIVGETGYG